MTATPTSSQPQIEGTSTHDPAQGQRSGMVMGWCVGVAKRRIGTGDDSQHPPLEEAGRTKPSLWADEHMT